jgi:hypothetical protein
MIGLQAFLSSKSCSNLCFLDYSVVPLSLHGPCDNLGTCIFVLLSSVLIHACNFFNLIMIKPKNGFIGVLIAVVLCSLPGCAPSRVNLYDGKDAVKIKHLNYNEGLIISDRVEVWAVNDRFIGSTYVGAITQLAPGLNKIVVHKYFHPGMGPVYEGFATLTAELQPGALLALNGKTDGGEIVVLSH